MNNVDNKYDWVDFFKELAKHLLKYKNRREKLFEKVREVYEGRINEVKNMENIDPFSIFSIFNSFKRNDIRTEFAEAIKKAFQLKASIPTHYSGVPVIPPNVRLFFDPNDINKDEVIDNLWKLFEAALKYASKKTNNNKEKLKKYFDKILSRKGIGDSYVTIGLFWIEPDTFITFDKRSKDYIYNPGKIDNLPKLEKHQKKITADIYFELIEAIKKFLASKKTHLKDFKELSAEAFCQNDDTKKSSNRAEKTTSLSDNQYTRKDFLNEVYIEESDYDKLCELLKRKQNVILQGAPGVGKTFAATRLAYSIIGLQDDKRVRVIQFHQSYSYEDFIEGFRPSNNGEFELKKGVFYDFCKKAENNPDQQYFFIIDEINRGNLNKIFGELFMLLEKDKRGIKVPLMYSGEDFAIPKNLYFLGLMNTSDRSLAMLDFALRRRFAFFEMKPAFKNKKFREYMKRLKNEKFEKLIAYIDKLNAEIAEDRSLGKGTLIGHSYFCNLDNADNQTIANILEYEVISLLKEYWFDNSEKLRECILELRKIIKES